MLSVGDRQRSIYVVNQAGTTRKQQAVRWSYHFVEQLFVPLSLLTFFVMHWPLYASSVVCDGKVAMDVNWHGRTLWQG